LIVQADGRKGTARRSGARVVGGDDLRVGGDALDQACKDPAGTDLDEGGDPGGAHRLDGADPVNAGREVVDELGPTGIGRRDEAGIGVGEERWVRVAERDAGQHRAHRLGGLGHERRMGRHRHRELQRRPGTELLRDDHGQRDRRALAADHDLAR
jgi:hypothetical protein